MCVSDVSDLVEFWFEFPPQFMLLRFLAMAKGYEIPHSARRRRQAAPSSLEEKEMFVHMWGGARMHTDSMPLHVQNAFAEAMKEASEEKENGRRG